MKDFNTIDLQRGYDDGMVAGQKHRGIAKRITMRSPAKTLSDMILDSGPPRDEARTAATLASIEEEVILQRYQGDEASARRMADSTARLIMILPAWLFLLGIAALLSPMGMLVVFLPALCVLALIPTLCLLLLLPDAVRDVARKRSEWFAITSRRVVQVKADGTRRDIAASAFTGALRSTSRPGVLRLLRPGEESDVVFTYEPHEARQIDRIVDGWMTARPLADRAVLGIA